MFALYWKTVLVLLLGYNWHSTAPVVNTVWPPTFPPGLLYDEMEIKLIFEIVSSLAVTLVLSWSQGGLFFPTHWSTFRSKFDTLRFSLLRLLQIHKTISFLKLHIKTFSYFCMFPLLQNMEVDILLLFYSEKFIIHSRFCFSFTLRKNLIHLKNYWSIYKGKPS